MSTENPMIILRRVVVCTVISLWLVGCSNDTPTSAPISTAGGKTFGKKSGDKKNATAPIIYNRSYNNIAKGSYNGNVYTVKRGDTLFYIAWITGNDYRELASKNNIPQPYSLNVGQSIQLDNVSGQSMLTAGNTTTNRIAIPPSDKAMQTKPVDFKVTSEYSPYPGKQNVSKMLPKIDTTASATAQGGTRGAFDNVSPVKEWKWPADNFRAVREGSKGIEIEGKRQQPIFATAQGKVVYSGNALRGYGKLIIIKHSDDYLSAYAHNDTILVQEQEEVKAGQKIATMGSTGADSVRLHFEIRYKGKSVNPLRYLPQR
ncbi:peptidase [Candidatus Fukatsuia symbiotica]|uniref:Peptidase n=2 Tax=Yersiniaceae TaxID=1903411 RepID=A0A2U8I3U1_9GAMM|nr:peptidase [Candidatus Fukatsuia symbiotica]